MSQIEAQTQHQAASPSRIVSTGPSTSLRVGDLGPCVSKHQLYGIFSQVGQVVSIHIFRDQITRQSLGFAENNYKTAQDATLALGLEKFTLVNGKPIRITPITCDSSRRKKGIGNIFIKHLEKSIDSLALSEKFSKFGTIRSAKVATDDSGQSKGYGYVQFEHEESAQSAIENTNGMLFNNKQVLVERFVCRQERDRSCDASNFKNVIVKNFAETTTDEELKKRFAVYGKIRRAVVILDSEGNSRHFGFVNFKNTDNAAKAVEALNGKPIDGKVWYVRRAKTQSEMEVGREKFEQERKERSQLQHGTNLYINNLDDTVDNEMLGELFAPFGIIKSCKVNWNLDGQSKGSGFVCFSTLEEAHCAVAYMNRRMVGSKPLYVAPARCKEARRAWLQTSVGAPTSVPIYSPFAPRIVAQYPYGQSPLELNPGEPTDFLYKQQMFAADKPGSGQNPNFYAPVVPSQNQHNGHKLARGMHGPIAPRQQQQHAQQMVVRRENLHIRHTSTARNTQDVTGDMLDGPRADAGAPQPVAKSIPALASGPVVDTKAMVGELLYPLVDVLEHDHAGKVTGALLQQADPRELLGLLRPNIDGQGC